MLCMCGLANAQIERKTKTFKIFSLCNELRGAAKYSFKANVIPFNTSNKLSARISCSDI